MLWKASQSFFPSFVGLLDVRHVTVWQTNENEMSHVEILEQRFVLPQFKRVYKSVNFKLNYRANKRKTAIQLR